MLFGVEWRRRGRGRKEGFLRWKLLNPPWLERNGGKRTTKSEKCPAKEVRRREEEEGELCEKEEEEKRK